MKNNRTRLTAPTIRRCLSVFAALFVSLMLTMSPAMAVDDAQATFHIKQAQKDLSDGNWGRSLARFRWLLLQGAPDQQREIAYQNTIATITNARPLQFSLSAALLPSTNVTNGSRHTHFVTDLGTFTIDSAEDRKSGIGLYLSGAATYTHAYDRGRTWSITTSVASNLYKEKELQMGQVGLSFAHEWLSSGQQTRLSLGIQDAMYRSVPGRDLPNFQSESLMLSRNQKLSETTWLGIQAQMQRVNYPERRYNNGLHRSLYVTPRMAFGQKTSVSLKAGIQSVGIRARHLSYQGNSLGLFVDRNEQNGLRWGVGFETHWRDYDSLFPSLSVNRNDIVNDLQLTASHARIQIKGKTPKLRCTFRDHGSNVALYDYRSTDCSISLNHQF